MTDAFYGSLTPCPIQPKTSLLCRRVEETVKFDTPLEFSPSSCKNIREIDGTHEKGRSTLTGAKPRRRNRTLPAPFQIHEDDDTKRKNNSVGRSKDESTGAASSHKDSLLFQPAQRFRQKVSFTRNDNVIFDRPEQGTRPGLRSTVDDEVEKNKTPRGRNCRRPEDPPKDKYKRTVRRDTVYIPPDDTTVASVFMGLFSPLKSQDTGILHIHEDTQINSLEAQIAKRQLAKKSATVSARRPPLRKSHNVAQESAIAVDVPGKNGGKENIPPGILGDANKKEKSKLPNFNAQLNKKPGRRKTVTQSPQGKSLPEKVSLAERSASIGKRNDSNPSTQSYCPKNTKMEKRKSVNRKQLADTGTSGCSSSTLSRVVIPDLTQKSLNIKYPLLTEDIPDPAMYEDNWLCHQETVITQLVNGLFQHAQKPTEFQHSEDILRNELLSIYQADYFTQLHKRLQVSLLYGSLSAPKHLISSGNRLKQDLGLKRKFMDIWMQVYDQTALRAAAETVLGRRLSHDNPMKHQETSKRSTKVKKRELEMFLDTLLLQNEDMDWSSVAEVREDRADTAGWEYARTILRSIMIIVLLDKARLSPTTTVPCNLFVSSSPYKSSVDVLQAMGHLLLPSHGDITKRLNHLGCEVEYKQHELQAYNYKIDNLAVDLRDGVRLARIVEILLYPSTSPFACIDSSLEDRKGNYNWPLSRRLKAPCTSRTAQLFNVQITLEELALTKGGGAIVGNTRPEDIVDGHRVKSMALLWGLVSKWGLVGLVDWDDLRKEINRLKGKRKTYQKGMTDQVNGEDAYGIESQEDEHTMLLVQWASVLAEIKGLRLENLTTSFADGRIYESIVDEYEDCILGKPLYNDHIRSDCQRNGGNDRSLGERLEALGCSSQFGRSSFLFL